MIIKQKKQNESQDEYYHDYGILSNALWILGRIKKYKPILLVLMVIYAVTGSAMSYIWSFAGKFVIELVEKADETNAVSGLIVIIAVAAAIELICRGFNTYTGGLRGFNKIYVRFKLLGECVAKTLYMNYEMLEDPKMLDMQQKAKNSCNDNSSGCEGMMRNISDFMVKFMLIAVTLTTLSVLDVRLVAVIIILSVLQYFFFVHTVKKDRKNVWNELAPVWRKINYMQYMTQDFSYAKDIRIFGMKDWLSGKQKEVNGIKTKLMVRSKNYWSCNSIFAHVISLLRNGITYGFLIYCVLYKELSIANFTLYLGIAATFSSAVTELLNGLGAFKDCSLKINDMRSFLDIKVKENETIPVPQNCDYTFTFENVSFKYPGQDKYAVKNLNLTLEKGKKLAVVGLNGAGKTTFIKLLLRLYDVTEGRILLNGIDIRNFDRLEYYKLFSPVFQNVEIFAFPMSENVSMSTAKVTDCEKAEECLRLAGMGDKIDELTNGVYTQLLKVIYDDGIDLSGGQKQKLALARALYKDAPIVVLDEPTAALDALAEYKMYKDFDKIIGSKSAVYISHRLSSTRFCDSIAMFKDSCMIEYGTHDELLAKNGAYAEMFTVQAQYYREEKEVEFVG